MALPPEIRGELELWLERERKQLTSTFDSMARSAVTEALIRQRLQPPWWWWRFQLWFGGLLWKYNPRRAVTRRRFARMDTERKWEVIGEQLTKTLPPRLRRMSKGRSQGDVRVKGAVPEEVASTELSVVRAPRTLTDEEDVCLAQAFLGQEREP